MAMMVADDAPGCAADIVTSSWRRSHWCSATPPAQEGCAPLSCHDTMADAASWQRITAGPTAKALARAGSRRWSATSCVATSR